MARVAEQLSVDTSATNAPGRSLYDSHSTQSSRPPVQFACLYTKHKTQKRKVWQDGRLVLQSSRARLFSATPVAGSADPMLDECEISGTQRQNLAQSHETQIETERFFIQIEGPWVEPTTRGLHPRNVNSNAVSSSMQKLMQRKFQRPSAYVPPPPAARPNRLQPVLGKRRRPLQPGELERIHYGSSSGSGTPNGTALEEMLPPSHVPVGANSYSRTRPEPPRQSQDLQLPVGTYRDLPSRVDQNCVQRQYSPASAVKNNSQQPLPRQEEEAATAVEAYTTPAPPKPTARNYGTPDAFVLHNAVANVQQQHVLKQGSSMQFASNDFNATGYYGFDEEEDEEEAETNDRFGSISPPTSWKNSAPPAERPWEDVDMEGASPFVFGGKNDSSDADDTGNQRDVEVPTPQHNTANETSNRSSGSTMIAPANTRTTSELMALFGAVPIARSSCAAESANKENTEDNQQEISPAPMEGNLPLASFQSQLPTAAAQSEKGEPAIKFYLPSPASGDSSSDDNEEE